MKHEIVCPVFFADDGSTYIPTKNAYFGNRDKRVHKNANGNILFVACRRRARGSLLAAGICTRTNYAQSVPLLPRPVGFYP